uniref:FAD-dependent oxidoreductase domain-containing protein 1 n=1 Tax=Meloidogyne enterolobii TaxID=390850 RepID=A0A6V7TUE0_MELEN|nr:unnamed protein product [Meloidogyne enterolobii]
MKNINLIFRFQQPNIFVNSSRCLSLSQLKQWQKYENERYFGYEPSAEEPWKRIKHAFSYDLRRAARRYREAKYDAFRRKYPINYMFKKDVQDYELLPMHVEFFIIGGGLTGSSIAFWIKQYCRDENITVSILESTDNFTKTRSMLGSGVVSQQFSIPEMVDLANFSAEFFRHAGEHLRILDNDPPDLHFLPVGVMHLARTQEEADAFKEAWKIQVDRGVHVALLNKEELKAKFPFMRFDDVVMGTLGLENEGVFDTWQLLSALREKNISLGVRYLKGDFEGVTSYNQGREVPLHGAVPVEEVNADLLNMHKINGVVIRPQMSGASPRPINCYKIFNAAGPWAGEIAKKAGVGFKGEMMRIPLPIVCTRRTNFVVHAPEVPPLSMPILMDSSGIFCRPDAVGHNYICGREPTKSDAAKTLKEEDQQIKSSDEPPIDYNEFYEQVWPLLVERVPSFRTAKVINAWHSYEDVNMFDEAPIIGEHLVHENFIQVCGLGGYGPQMSIAIGKALSERFYDRAYVTVNLRKFDMRRIMHGSRCKELFRCV